MAHRGLRWWQLALLFGLVDGVPHAPSARSQRHEYKRPPPELHDTGILGEVGRIEAAQFGVLADGRHDDTAALQAAIDAADGRSAVWLPAGCMILTKPLVFNTTEQWAPGLKLEGAGVGVTVLDNQVTNSAAVIARSVTKYHFQLGGWIRDLTINSSTHPFNSSGVEVEGVYNFVVDSVRVDGMTGDGMINTNLMMDGDGAVELQILNSWFLNNEGHGFNSHFGFCNNSLGCTTPNVQSSFATFKNNYFASNHKAALRYMGLNGIIEGNGFTTNPAGGLLIDYSGSNNAQITVTANSFENNGSPAIDVRSAIGASFVETEIAQSVPLDFPSNAGIAVGTNVLDKWQVVYTTVFEDTYVRVDPRTGGVEGYTMFELGEISNLVQIKNTLWHQFDGKHHTRYRDKGTSNRLSDAFETTVAGPSMLMLHEGANDDVSLPYLKGYSPLSSFTEDTGTLFGFAASGNATLSGIVQGIENRRLVLVNEGSYLLTVLAECAKSEPSHRFRSSMNDIAIAPGGSASFVYVGGVVQRWQLTGRG